MHTAILLPPENPELAILLTNSSDNKAMHNLVKREFKLDVFVICVRSPTNPGQNNIRKLKSDVESLISKNPEQYKMSDKIYYIDPILCDKDIKIIIDSLKPLRDYVKV